MPNISDRLFDMIDNGRIGKNKGLDTGLEKLDKYTGGTLKGLYTLYFGVSGSGKSAIVLYRHIYRPLKDNSDKNIKLIYFSLELSSEILLAKLLCLYIYEEYKIILSYNQLLSKNELLDDEIYEYVQKSKTWLKSIENKLIIFDSGLNEEVFKMRMSEILCKYGSFISYDEGKTTVYNYIDPEMLIIVVMDHLGLVTPRKGFGKKEEIDAISTQIIGIRDTCKVSFFVLMQENRNSSNMDRRKSDMTECSSEDIMYSNAPYNDCEVCIGIYYPLKHKVINYRGYPIINSEGQEFRGMRDRFRSAILIKNRYGISEVAVHLNFFGENGVFYELPKPDQIFNFKSYTMFDIYLNKDENIKDFEEIKKEKIKEEKINSINEFNLNYTF